MNNIEVNFNNLTENERKQLLSLVEKSNKGVMLSKLKKGETFKIGDIEFIKFYDTLMGGTVAVTKDIVFNSEFGKNNNFGESKILSRLYDEFLPKLENIIGKGNILNVTTDLTTLDGLKPYGDLEAKITLPTFDFYRKNVDIFDKYPVNEWWWTATPESAKPHDEPNWITCVSPSGIISRNIYFNCNGVRPLLHFVSSISVSRCE